MHVKSFFVYILTDSDNSVLYIGVTNDISRRYFEHLAGDKETFAGKYQCRNLVYIEEYVNPIEAITREKQLKKWSRAKKISLIMSENKSFRNLHT